MMPVRIVFRLLSTLVGVVMALVLFLPVYMVMGIVSALGVAYRLIREHLL